MDEEDEPTQEEMLAQMEDDANALLRVAELVEINRAAVIQIMKRRSPLFEKDEKGAHFLCTIIRDVLTDFSEELIDALRMVKDGEVDIKAIVVGRESKH